MRLSSALCVLVFVLGCSKEPPPWADRTTSGVGFPCEVDRVLAESCRRCHWQPLEHDAPFVFDTWDALQKKASGKHIHQLMLGQLEAGLMPPVDLALEPPVTALSSDQKSRLMSWLRAGAPRSDETCAP